MSLASNRCSLHTRKRLDTGWLGVCEDVQDQLMEEYSRINKQLVHATMHYASSVIIVTINFWRIRLLADDIYSWCNTKYNMRIGWRRRGLLSICSC